MKRLFLFLCILFALATPALATDVAIGAMTIDGFSPSSIGNDRSIAVSTAGGSPIVTSAGLFPIAITGIGGFTVRIDGTLYTVASVASASSLTLTTNYSGTPGAQTMTLFKYVEMRVYADRAFQPLGSTQVVQPGTVGSGSFFKRFAASIVNNGSTNQLFIPAIVLPATTDALITNQARYTIPLYRPSGSLVQSFFCPSNLAQLRLPPATPTTWTAICSFNSPPAVVPPANVAYTRGEIDNRFPSCSINQAIFYAASGNKQSCLTIGSGLSIAGGVLTAGGAGGYGTIQEEGTPLTQRTILNFVGFGFTAADESGPTRTNLSLDPDLNALAALAGTGFPARTAADTWLLRSLTQPAAGLTITNPAGVAGNPTFALANDLAALEGLGGTGFSARTAADAWAVRTLTQPAAGLTITNPAGTAGDPTFALANDLSAVEGLSTTGIAARTASDTWTTRTITGTTGQVTLTDGNGVSGNPTVSLPTTIFLGTAGGSPAAGTLKGPDASGTNIAGANLVLAGGPGTGNAAQGQAVAKYPLTTASGTTVQTLSATAYPFVTSQYIDFDSNTSVSNTTTETALLGAADDGSTKTIEAGLARVGRTFRLHFSGRIGATASPTVTLRLKLGSTTIATYTGTVTNADSGWRLVIYATIGAGAITVHTGYFEYGDATATKWFRTDSAGTVIDFTVAQTWELTVQWGTAAAANNFIYTLGNIEILR